MARSIYCSNCRKEKEPGRDNESCCKPCKSERNKLKRAKQREALGLPPFVPGKIGKKLTCCCCGELKERREYGYCNSCRRKKDNENRLANGVTKKHNTGLCPCGKERAPYSKAYCVECLSKRAKEKKVWQSYTPEQKARRNELQNARRPKIGRVRKEFLDISLMEKPKFSKKKQSVIDGVRVICGRPNCENTDDLLSSGWCKPCHAAYYRERRKFIADSPESEEQKIKRSVRVLTRNYITAGKLIKEPCEVCGTEKDVEAHHDDYNKPLDVRWLCRKHHREHHNNEKN